MEITCIFPKEYTLHLTGSGKVMIVTFQGTYLHLVLRIPNGLPGRLHFTGHEKAITLNVLTTMLLYKLKLSILFKELVYITLYRQWKGKYGLTTVTFPADAQLLHVIHFWETTIAVECLPLGSYKYLYWKYLEMFWKLALHLLWATMFTCLYKKGYKW